MRIAILLFFILLFQMNVFGIERYAHGDTLYNWSTKLNLREKPDLNAGVIMQIGKGEMVIVLSDKYGKEGDAKVNLQATDWEKAITGVWVQVSCDGKIGYVFDAYLSKYRIEEIRNVENYLAKWNLRMRDYETYERFLLGNGIIIEIGGGIEWGIKIYYIPDLSVEEAIYLIKEQHIDYKFGEQHWEIDLENNRIKMTESDGTSYLDLAIYKVENICIVRIADGV